MARLSCRVITDPCYVVTGRVVLADLPGLLELPDTHLEGGQHRLARRVDRLVAGRRLVGRGQVQDHLLGLAQQVRAGQVAHWWFEPLSLRLPRPEAGQPTRLTIDFMVLLPDGTTYLADAKGTVVDNDVQRVAMKCAAEQYPLWIFRIVKQRTKALGGGWEVTEL